MNKNFDKKNENAKPSDNGIVTKKGFMLSFPKRKGTQEKVAPATAAPKKQENMQNNSQKGAQNERNGEKRQGNNHNHHHKNHGKPQRPQQNRENQKPNVNTNVPAAANEKKNQNIQERPQGHGGKNYHKHDKKKFNNNNNVKKPQGQKLQTPVQNQGAKQEQKQKTVGKIDAGILASLKSPAAFKKEQTEQIRDYSKTQVPEKIDFEKFKNLPTLAEQIAAEEARRAPKAVATVAEEGKMEIVGVRFREAGKIYYFAPGGISAPFGTAVIVETARGLEYGIVAIGNRFVPEGDIVSPLKSVVRLATNRDREIYEQNKEQEAEAARIFNEKTQKLNLEMKLVGVEYTFDCSRLLFYFTADGRVDFRELVKELAFAFKTRIELRQVGVRDAAKIFGGLGVCGRPLCCSTFLGDFMQVSIKMAKDQNLSLNSAKISGACGKLLCCLRYENEVYQIEYEKTPKNGAIVETPEGRGVVTESIPLKASVKVLLDSKKDSPPVLFHRDDVSVKGYMKNEEKTDEDLKGLEE